MGADENHHHTCKRSRVGNGSDEDVDGGEAKGNDGLCSWSQQSRIFRVSRATGGKDRHSKVYTAKGLRDRRVRLSVSTAIQFYDLQDRLGYDQPSKAIEWLIKAASAAIAELPALEASFPVPPRAVEKLEIEPPQQHCSSASETSKGSVLYLSRSENRVKARERARERAAKDKEKDQDDDRIQSSFADLLTGSGSNGTQMGSTAKQIRYLPVTAMADYFSQSGLFTQAQKSNQPPFSQAGNSSPVGMLPFGIVAATGDHPEFSFLQDHHGPVHAAGDYNLNFSIPSCVTGFNRGTLQSNSPSQLPHYHHHLQKLSSPVDGLNLPLFASSAASATSDVNHFPAGFDGRLQLYYGEEHRHADLKGKGKS